MIVSKRMHRLKNASFFFFFSFVWARWWYLACVCMCADGHIVYTLKMAGCFFFFSLRCGCYLQRKLIRFSNDDSRAFEISFSILWVTLSSIFTFFFFSLCLFDLCFVSVLSFRLWLEVFLFFLFCFHGAPHSLCVTSPPLTFSLRLPLFFPLLLFCLFAVVCCCFCFFFFFLRTKPTMFNC